MVTTPIASLPDLKALLQGDILLTTRSHSAWGGAVTARMYLPLSQEEAWQKLTDYPRWTQYFRNINRSEVVNAGLQASLQTGLRAKRKVKRLYQAASKAFLFFSAQVEIHLKVLETHHQRIEFLMESGNFNDFSADMELYPYGDGIILTYSVQATPTIPVPSLFIQEAIRLDLPANLRQMRQVMCGGQ